MQKPVELKVCLFSHSSQLHGAERCLLDLIKILLTKGISCAVVMPGSGSLKNMCESLGILVKTFSSSGWWCSEYNHEAHPLGLLDLLESELGEILKFVEQYKPNVIYSQTIVSPIGAVVAESLELPHLLGIREHGYLNFYFSFQESMQAFYDTSDYIFSVSNSVAKHVLGENYQKQNVKINYAHFDISSKFKNLQCREIGDKIKIGIFGFISENKNQLEIIKAVCILLKKNFNIELYVVGSYNYSYYQKLLEYIASTPYQDKIIFTGYTQEVIDLMSTMSIVVSCTKTEGFGRTLVEAILLKIPIIYANTSGPREIYTRDEHGLAYEIGNESDLATQVIKTINFPQETYQRVCSAYEYVTKKFTQEVYAQPVIEALYRVVDKPIARKKLFVIDLIKTKISLNIMQSKEFYSRLLNKKNIKIVFIGASSLLEKNWNYLTENRILPDYICDNDSKKQGKYFKNYKIYSPIDLFNKQNIYFVIITSSYVNEIKRELSCYKSIAAVEIYSTLLLHMKYDMRKIHDTKYHTKF